MNLNDRDWKPFKIEDIFVVNKGIYLNKKNIIEGNTPYITAKAIDNGINDFIGNGALFLEDAITIEKISLSAFYQPHEFYCSHDVSVIQNDNLNEYVSLFVCTMIKRQGVKYSYGRQAQLNVVKRETIFLPIDESGKPDWLFMDNYIKQRLITKSGKYKKYITEILLNIIYKKIVSLSEKEWKKFMICDICEIFSGKDIYDVERVNGDIPYITATSTNNGMKYFVSNSNTTLGGNAISVNRNGSVGYAFYHKYEALYSNDCRKLKLKQYDNEYVSLFLTNQIMQQKEKYNYGYKLGTARLKKQYIMLPTNDKNEPDYEYMEQYIKNVMFKKYNEYIS